MEERRATSDTPTSDAGGPAGVPLAHARIGRYTIVRVIGAGGMGIVYEAEQDVPRRTVALKVMNTGDGRELDAAGVRRFLNEAQFLAAQSHRAICQVFDAGVYTPPDGSMPVPYIAMEHVAGARRLDVHCRALAMAMRERVALFAKVCEAVGHAHDKGVIHRDLKHENVLVNEAGEPKVIDFGIARVLGSDVFRTRITRAGQVLGTFQYMSPEQLAGRHDEVDKRSDVYALGVMLYELVCGRSPREFEGLSPALACAKVRETAATRPTRVTTEVDPDLETIVLAAIDPEPGRRYADAGELCAELRRWLAREPIVKRPLGSVAKGWRLLRMLAGKNRAVAAMVVACAAFAMAAMVITPPLSKATRSTERWAQWMMSNSTLGEPLGELSPVVVVTLGDQDDLEQLSRDHGQSSLDPSQTGHLRPIMGAVIRAATAARAQVVVLDFGIRDSKPVVAELTAPLVDAVRGAVSEGVGVVVGVAQRPTLTVREDVLAEIAHLVRWGDFNMGVSQTGPWADHVAHRIEGMDPSPSLALAAYASYLRPDPAQTLRIGLARDQSHLVDIWFSSDRGVAATGVVRDRVPPIVITGTVQSESADGGPAETTGVLSYEVPDDSVLRGATLTLTEFFARAADGSLGLAVRGKIVLFGDIRHGENEDISPDRKRPQGLPRIYGHATAMAMLARHVGPHVPSDTVGNVWTILACLTGALGAIMVATWGRLVCLVAGLTVVVALSSVIAYGGTSALVDPLEPVIGLWLGAIGSFLLTRHRG